MDVYDYKEYDFQANWQPISEGCIPKEGLYFITWEGTWGNTPVRDRWIEKAEYDGDNWHVDHIEQRGFRNIKVIAWMELPKRWEGD